MTSRIKQRNIEEFNKFMDEHSDLAEEIVRINWGYLGDQPRQWLAEEVKGVRSWLLGHPKKNYKCWDRFLANWLRRAYAQQKPQELRSYMNNDKEKNYYKRKE